MSEWAEGDYTRNSTRGEYRVYKVVHIFEDGDALAWWQNNLTERVSIVLKAGDRNLYRSI